MTNIFIGAIIGISVTILTILIKKWLDNNHLSIRWTRVIGILIIVHLIYSFIGIIVSPYYTKPNGNVCNGWSYGINVCSGDINAE